jgi:hypothetical protein
MSGANGEIMDVISAKEVISNTINVTNAVITNLTATTIVGNISMTGDIACDDITCDVVKLNELQAAGTNVGITDNLEFLTSKDIIFSGSGGTEIGTTAAEKFAFHGATPVIQHIHIADAPGDSAANNAVTINAILVALEEKGILAAA